MRCDRCGSCERPSNTAVWIEARESRKHAPDVELMRRRAVRIVVRTALQRCGSMQLVLERRARRPIEDVSRSTLSKPAGKCGRVYTPASSAEMNLSSMWLTGTSVGSSSCEEPRILE